MSDLFRKEVFDHKKAKSWEGDIALPNTFSLKILILITILILIAIVLVFKYGSYTERRTVTGYLTPIDGVIKIVAPSTGVINSIKIKNNQLVDANEDLLTIVNKQYGVQGEYNSQINKNLEEQLYVVNHQEGLIRKDFNERENIAKLEIEEAKKKKAFNADIIQNQEQQINIAQKTYQEYLNIGTEGAISELEIQSIQGRVIDLKSELYRLNESKSALSSQIESKLVEIKQIKNQEAKEINDLKSKRISIQQSLLELEKDTTKTIKSPTAGRLTALSVHENQIVNNAQLLLNIIPLDNQLKVNLLIPPRDIGFIEIGNVVSIRYDAFPYEKYGQAVGTIVSISKTTLKSADVTEVGGFTPPNLDNASFYIVDVSLDKQSLLTDGIEQDLTTGMTLSADIKLESRKLYQWVLAPLISLRERNI